MRKWPSFLKVASSPARRAFSSPPPHPVEITGRKLGCFLFFVFVVVGATPSATQKNETFAFLPPYHGNRLLVDKKKSRFFPPIFRPSLVYLIVGRCGFNRPGDDQTDLGTRLTQNGGDLLRAHASKADFADLEDMVTALESSILLGGENKTYKKMS